MHEQRSHTGTIWSYTAGFLLSIVLTFIPFGLIAMHNASGHSFPTHTMLMAAFVALALLQLVVQLAFFLHIEHEAGPRWNLAALLFALVVVVIVVGGTLWIMHNLARSHVEGTPFMNGVVTPQTESD